MSRCLMDGWTGEGERVETEEDDLEDSGVRTIGGAGGGVWEESGAGVGSVSSERVVRDCEDSDDERCDGECKGEEGREDERDEGEGSGGGMVVSEGVDVDSCSGSGTGSGLGERPGP